MISYQRKRKFVAATKTVAYSMVVGPLYGTAVTLVGLLPFIVIGSATMRPVNALSIFTLFGDGILGFPFFAFFGYWFGGIQATITGIVFALLGLWQGRLPIWSILPGFAVPFTLVLLYNSIGPQVPPSQLDKWHLGAQPFASIHLLAAACVYLTVRHLWNSADAKTP